jgi:hypothetical protein
MVDPNTDFLILFSFVGGIVFSVVIWSIALMVFKAPQPHCGVCVCP